MNPENLHQAIKEVFMSDWDPIGIKDWPELQDVPQAQDEYDAYVADVCQMLQLGYSEEDIYQFLQHIATNYMCIYDFDSDISKAVAHKVKALGSA